METIEKTIYQEIMERLKDAPKSVLERVLGYVDGVLEVDVMRDFKLTKEQKDSLLEIKKRPYSAHTEIETFFSEMKEKYGV